MSRQLHPCRRSDTAPMTRPSHHSQPNPSSTWREQLHRTGRMPVYRFGQVTRKPLTMRGAFSMRSRMRNAPALARRGPTMDTLRVESGQARGARFDWRGLWFTQRLSIRRCTVILASDGKHIWRTQLLPFTHCDPTHVFPCAPRAKSRASTMPASETFSASLEGRDGSAGSGLGIGDDAPSCGAETASLGRDPLSSDEAGLEGAAASGPDDAGGDVDGAPR